MTIVAVMPVARYYGDGYAREIVELIQRLSARHGTWQVFEDFLEMSAISISNTVDWVHKEEREARYMDIVKRYSKDEIQVFPKLLANLVEALEAAGRPEDILGKVFHTLELHNKYKGQFFTPQHICDFMGMVSLDKSDPDIVKKGYLKVCEPCAGSGAMILGFAHAMQSNGYNHCKQMVVTATDVDLKCVHMCYLQLSLLGIPAVIIHGNSLSMQEWSRWYTPVYMLDGWLWRERCGNDDKPYIEDEALKRATDPVYAAIKNIEDISPQIARETQPKADILQEEPVYDITLKDNPNGQMSLF